MDVEWDLILFSIFLFLMSNDFGVFFHKFIGLLFYFETCLFKFFAFFFKLGCLSVVELQEFFIYSGS